MAMKKIKAILFDLDGTLFHHLPSSGEVFMEHLRSLGFQISDADRIRAEHWTHSYFAHSPEIQADSKLDFIQLAPVERYEKSEKSDNWSEGAVLFGFRHKSVMSEKDDESIKFV